MQKLEVRAAAMRQRSACMMLRAILMCAQREAYCTCQACGSHSACGNRLSR